MLVYYEIHNGKFQSYDGEFLKETDNKPNGFYLVKPYEATKKELIKYYNKLYNDIEELCEVSKLDFETLSNSNYSKLISTLFKIYRTDQDIKYDRIEFYEYEFFENCFNGGLNTATEGTFENVKAFDYKKFYPNLLGGDKTTKEIPITKGKLYNLEEIPPKKNIKYGIYRVKITSNSPNISKVFAFNENNYYTHADLKRAIDLSYSKRFEVKISLIKDEEPNALIYDNLIKTKKIFIRYVKKLKECLLKYPDNKLCKFVMSSVWGNLSQKGRTRKLTNEEYEKLPNKDEYNLIDAKMKFINGEFIHIFELLHINNTQISNYRLKAFITSFGRNKMSENLTRVSDLNDIIRVCTDGVILKQNATYAKRFVSSEFIQDGKYNNKNITIKNVNKVLTIK